MSPKTILSDDFSTDFSMVCDTTQYRRPESAQCMDITLDGRSQSIPDTNDAPGTSAPAELAYLLLSPDLDSPLDITQLTAAHGPGTYQVYGEYSSAGVRQNDLDQSNGQETPSLHAASSWRVTHGKRPIGDDGSDAEDDNRGKLRRTDEEQSGNGRLPCPFQRRYPQKCECKTLKGWKGLREHLTGPDRAHGVRHQCARCGETFNSEHGWEKHTRSCQNVSREEFKSDLRLTRDQETRIRSLKKRGKKSPKSAIELWRDVWDILFEQDLCMDWPWSNTYLRSNNGGSLDADHYPLSEDENFRRTVSSLPGIEKWPDQDRGHIAIEWYRILHGYFNSMETQIPVAHHLGNDLVQGQQSTASCTGVQAPSLAASNKDSALSYSYFPDGGTNPSQTDPSSFPSHYLADSIDYSEAVSAGLQPRKSTYNFDPDSLSVDPSLPETTNLQRTQSFLSSDSSSRPPEISTGMLSGLLEHPEGRIVHLESGQGQYLNPEHTSDFSDSWFDDWCRQRSGAGNAEQD